MTCASETCVVYRDARIYELQLHTVSPLKYGALGALLGDFLDAALLRSYCIVTIDVGDSVAVVRVRVAAKFNSDE